MAGTLCLQTGLQDPLHHLGQEPALTGQLQTPTVDLIHQIVQQPGLDHPLDYADSAPSS